MKRKQAFSKVSGTFWSCINQNQNGQVWLLQWFSHSSCLLGGNKSRRVPVAGAGVLDLPLSFADVAEPGWGMRQRKNRGAMWGCLGWQEPYGCFSLQQQRLSSSMGSYYLPVTCPEWQAWRDCAEQNYALLGEVFFFSVSFSWRFSEIRNCCTASWPEEAGKDAS